VSTIVLDGLNEEDFRRSIENRLREGRPGAAIDRLRPLLAPYAKPGGILPERFLEIEAGDLVLSGWDQLGEAVARHDKPERPVTAITIAFGWPGEVAPEPDSEGCLRPHVETSYYSDNAYPFSQSGREDLLEGYSFYGCTWNGDCEASDTVLALEGIDDLYGALARLEMQLMASDEPDEASIRAGSLGSCLLSVLLVQAVAEQITRDGLPRPLCVMAGSNGMYPYFDAPVAGMPEETRKAAAAQEDEEAEAEDETQDNAVVEPGRCAPGPRYSSLLMTGIPRAKKRAVLVLAESDDELTDRIARLRNLNHTHIQDSEYGEDGEHGETREDSEIGTEASPSVPQLVKPDLPHLHDLPVPPDVHVTVNADIPLLAQKPPRRPRDLNDMFGLTPLDASALETPSREVVERVTSAPPPIRSEPAAGPGFTLLDPDLQQRLQSLISASAAAIAEAPPPTSSEPAYSPALQGLPPQCPVMEFPGASTQESLRVRAIKHSIATVERLSLRSRFWDKTKTWISDFIPWR
jgi:hypothetical protein